MTSMWMFFLVSIFFGFAPFSALKFVMKECMYYCIALIRKLWMIMIEWSSESEFVITLVYFPVSLTPYGVSYYSGVPNNRAGTIIRTVQNRTWRHVYCAPIRSLFTIKFPCRDMVWTLCKLADAAVSRISMRRQ